MVCWYFVRSRASGNHNRTRRGFGANRGLLSEIALLRQRPIGAFFEPHATIPSCSISAVRKQVATGSSILREQLLQYSLCGGCCDSMCCSARPFQRVKLRHFNNNQNLLVATLVSAVSIPLCSCWPVRSQCVFCPIAYLLVGMVEVLTDGLLVFF